LTLKQKVVEAQLAAGQVPQLDQLTISQGEKEERNRWLLPVGGLGLVVGLAVGVEAAKLWEKRKPKSL
jgi:hypothetical protein